MRKIMMFATLTALLGCSDHRPAERARAYAAGINAITPKTFGNGLEITGAKAGGSTVIFQVWGLPQDYLEKTPEQITSELASGACNSDGFKDALKHGVSFRFELQTGNGDDLPAVSVDQC